MSVRDSSSTAPVSSSPGLCEAPALPRPYWWGTSWWHTLKGCAHGAEFLAFVCERFAVRAGWLAGRS